MNCLICHTNNSEGANFCGKCGNEILTHDRESATGLGYSADESETNKTKIQFGNAIKIGFTRYFDFRGRSSRAEFWWWNLFTFLVAFALGISDLILLLITQDVIFLFGVLRIFFALATIVPSITVTVRRLHDLNRTGWWLVATLIGYLALIIPGMILSLLLLIWFCKKGEEGENRYGNRYDYISN